MIWRALLILVVTSVSALASAPPVSERPVARASVDVTPVALVPDAPVLRPLLRPRGTAVAEPRVKRKAVLRPILRPGAPQPPIVAADPAPTLASATSVQLPEAFAVLRPKTRPRAVVRRGVARDKQLAAGRICGSRDIQGEVIGRVPGRLPGCGVAQAVRVRSVSGVALSTPATMDCNTAQAVNALVDGSMKPAFRRTGGGLRQIRVAAHYACRTRNNQPGARISEHGKGKAIDISGFTMRDGSTITVLEGWNHRRHGKSLRSIHKKACGPFGTVLGPDSNRFHRDHFHFDTASYRSGPYCR